MTEDFLILLPPSVLFFLSAFSFLPPPKGDVIKSLPLSRLIACSHIILTLFMTNVLITQSRQSSVDGKIMCPLISKGMSKLELEVYFSAQGDIPRLACGGMSHGRGQLLKYIPSISDRIVPGTASQSHCSC